jgi:hypothetical protein
LTARLEHRSSLRVGGVRVAAGSGAQALAPHRWSGTACGAGYSTAVLAPMPVSLRVWVDDYGLGCWAFWVSATRSATPPSTPTRAARTPAPPDRLSGRSSGHRTTRAAQRTRRDARRRPRQQPAPDPLGSVPAGPQRVCSSPNDDDPQRNPGPLHGMYPQRRRLADRTDDRHTFEKEEGSREKAKHSTLAHQDRGKEPHKQPPHPSSFSKGCSPPPSAEVYLANLRFH